MIERTVNIGLLVPPAIFPGKSSKYIFEYLRVYVSKDESGVIFFLLKSIGALGTQGIFQNQIKLNDFAFLDLNFKS